MYTIPNLLSLFRIVAAPFLLLAGWFGMPGVFFVLLCLMLLSDALDGYFARKLKQTTALGARLDSIGDLTTYLSTALAAWWLWPELIAEEALFVIAAIALYIAPQCFSFVKFGRLASYHTWISKVSAVLMSAAILLLLALEVRSVFHFAVLYLLIDAVEHIAITLTLRKPVDNIRSY